MARYAEGTTVAVDKTLAEIRRLLEAHGADRWAHGSGPEQDVVQFSLHGYHYRFNVERPDLAALRAEYVIESVNRGVYQYTAERRADNLDWKAKADAEWRRRWRARLMWLKAQLEFGEDVPVEQAMLANLVLPDGRTFGGWAGPQVELMYETGRMPPLLGSGG